MAIDKDFRAAVVAEVVDRKQVDALVRALIKVLDEYEGCEGIENLLEAFGPRAAPAIPNLVRNQLRTGSFSDQTFQSLGARADTLARRVAEGLAHSTPEVRKNAAVWLGNLGPDAHAAAPALLPRLEDKDNGVRLAAVKALGLIAAESQQVVPPLARLAHDCESPVKVRQEAVIALTNFGPRARAATSALLEVLKEPDSEITPIGWTVIWGERTALRLLAL